ncbi:MAG TPA: hypothetical protein DEP97_01260 [Erythrobacter sp.]|nr:hypothetical protein [Erythrobacter sp.]
MAEIRSAAKHAVRAPQRLCQHPVEFGNLQQACSFAALQQRQDAGYRGEPDAAAPPGAVVHPVPGHPVKVIASDGGIALVTLRLRAF